MFQYAFPQKKSSIPLPLSSRFSVIMYPRERKILGPQMGILEYDSHITYHFKSGTSPSLNEIVRNRGISLIRFKTLLMPK